MNDPNTPPGQTPSPGGTPPTGSIMSQSAPGGTPPPGQSPPQGGTPPPATGPDWLPEDMREVEGLKKFHEGGPAALAKSYLELEKTFQGKIPGEDATDEEKASFWNKLGRPETPEGYQYEKPQNLPEGVEWSDESLDLFRAAAHQAGYTQEQFKMAVDYDTQQKINAATDAVTNAQRYIQEGIGELKKAWGAGYDEKVKMAALTLKTVAGDDLYAKAEAEGLNNNPLHIQIMEIVGSHLKESGRIDATNAIHQMTLTPEEATREQQALSNDKNHPMFKAFNDKRHPDHEKAQKRFTELSQLKRGKPLA